MFKPNGLYKKKCKSCKHPLVTLDKDSTTQTFLCENCGGREVVSFAICGGELY